MPTILDNPHDFTIHLAPLSYIIFNKIIYDYYLRKHPFPLIFLLTINFT